ncbi:MAG: carbamoyltransferase HypF, partial [Bacteroidota bacterium]
SEHQLLKKAENVLGVIWDGTGYGTDQQIWGGEFFGVQNQSFVRLDHLSYFPHLLGDKMSREPRLSALSLLRHNDKDLALIQPAFTENEWTLYCSLLTQAGLSQTSSMGRLFDAVAAIIGLNKHVSYEGEAAMLLEAQAWQEKMNWRGESLSTISWPSENPLQIESWLPKLLADLRSGASVGWLALKFHVQCIEMVRYVADLHGYIQLAFSGGVWQNALLVDLADELLGPNYTLYFHEKLPANDANISYGQLALAQQGWLAKQSTKKLSACV